MLNIYYYNCCGIDVHKKIIVATNAITNSENVTTYQTKSFSTFPYDLQNLKDWLQKNNCKDVCMESTGKYWIPIFNILEDSCNVVVSHPKYVRAIPGKKTDKKDSIWIADLFKHGLAEPSFIPPKDIRDLRELMRYRKKLVNMKSSEKNRFQNSLTVSNIVISNIISDTFGKTSQSILKLMLSKDTKLTMEDITPLLRKNLKATPQDILNSIDAEISKVQASKMNVCLEHYNDIISCIEKLDLAIFSIALKYQKQLQLLLTVPGINDISALTILSEIGYDMSVFVDSKHLCSWAGLTPQNNESAGKKKSVKIARAGVYIKPVLVQCANAAIKDKSCPYFRQHFNDLAKRRNKKRAIIAIARQLLTSIYHMLSKDEEFNLDYYSKLEIKQFKPKDKELTIDNAIKLLQKQGYIVSCNN